MLVGVYLDPRPSSTTSQSAESGNYEAFVMRDKTEPTKLRVRGYWLNKTLFILCKRRKSINTRQ